LTGSRKSRVSNTAGRRDFLWKSLAAGALLPGHLRAQCVAFRTGLAAFRFETPAFPPPAKEPITSNADFFVRNHFGIPKIDAEAWNLSVEGMASTPLKLSYSDLLLMASVQRSLTFECAGNVSGGIGVGNAVWAGLSLADVLKQAGIRSGVTTIVLYGADSGEGEGLLANTHYARAIPFEKAMDPSTLLAYEMNGSPLPADHGFPMRALVPGWYGMDSVKWLTRIELTNQPFDGYFQQKQYVALTGEARRPIARMLVSSKFLRPAEDEEIHSKTYRLEGVAWAGERKVAKVEVRIGSGGSWQTVDLTAVPAALIWTPWSYDWRVPGPGQYTLEVRATDDEGHTQPEARDSKRQDGYELNTPHRITVTVRA
jgi:DMSO/TMAO reductase YedYZ molybdopterin-dependent catalytic subunit